MLLVGVHYRGKPKFKIGSILCLVVRAVRGSLKSIVRTKELDCRFCLNVGVFVFERS